MSRGLRSPIHGLYAITPDEADTARLEAMVAASLEGGARVVQYRNKSAGTTLQLRQAQCLQILCRRFGVPLIVNDSVDVALAVEAAGVHLGAGDLDLFRARQVLPHKIVGMSCYNRLDLAQQAQAGGADYVAFGSFFASSTKPGAVNASFELLRQAKRQLTIPLVAIGGITPSGARELVSAGADAIAVITALFGAQDIRQAAMQFNYLFEE